ncbi:hypothetical protein BDN71DRAFT_1444394 [Pleurotus eryngii]|uniref:F-box domain-containing protein n=1 Tax=Pleurotus eryngii TaxID=5323 RepID=A0A9P6A3L4_PLEER|nr:hypothetical protein BDN71DRAFT_1444394 [Pleurotus eryngii]
MNSTMIQTSPTPSLPIELVIIILQQSYYKNQKSRDPDYITLAAAALVHRSWTSAAQALLFRHITYLKSKSFMEAHADPVSMQHLLQHVRILDIGLGMPTDPETTPDCDIDHLPALLRRCTGLYELVLSIRSSLSFEGVTFSKMKELADSHAVRLRALNITCSPHSPIVYQLLSLFPTVNFLSVWSELSGVVPRNIKARFSLSELKMARAMPEDTLVWLLEKSRDTLTVLDLRDPPSRTALTILESYAPNIRSLRLMIQTTRMANFVRSCESLIDLTVLNLPMTVEFSKPPPSLRSLIFVNHAGSRSLMKRVIAMVLNLPNLKHLTCDEASSPMDRNFPELKVVCEERGVMLHVTNVFYAMTVEEPVLVHRFPRRRSLSNFSEMNSGTV